MSVKITVSQVAPSKRGLLLGLRLEDDKGKWVRFGMTVLVVDELKYHERQLLLSWLEDAAESPYRELDQPLF